MPRASSYNAAQFSDRACWVRQSFALIDSGATDHIVHDMSLLSDFKPFNIPISIQVGNGQKLSVVGYGTLSVKHKNHLVHFTHTLFVPGMKCNLLSVPALDVSGFKTTISDRRAVISHESDPDFNILSAPLVDGLYTLDIQQPRNSKVTISSAYEREPDMHEYTVLSQHDPESENFVNTVMLSLINALGPLYNEYGPMSVIKHASPAVADPTAQQPTAAPEPDPQPAAPEPTQQQQHTPEPQPAPNIEADLWHARLGHIAKTTLQHTCTAVNGIPSYTDLSHVYGEPCRHCIAGRFPESSHYPREHRANIPLTRVYVDCTGKHKQGWDGSTFTLNMIDEYTGYAMTFCMTSKDQVPKYLREGINRFHQLGNGNKIQEIRSDQGSEFHNETVMTLLAEYSITLTHSSPYVPQQNGVVERLNRSIAEITRCLLSHSGRSPTYWPDAYKHAVYLYNRRVASGKQKTHYELLTGKVPNLTDVRVWGCTAYVRVPTALQKEKFGARGVKCIYFGHDEYSTGYKVYDPTKKSTYAREDVIFSEKEFGKIKFTDHTNTPAVYTDPATENPTEGETMTDPTDPAPLDDEIPNVPFIPETPVETDDVSVHRAPQPRKRKLEPVRSPARSTRSKHPDLLPGVHVASRNECETEFKDRLKEYSVFTPVVYHAELALPANYVLNYGAVIDSTTPASASPNIPAYLLPNCPVVSPPPVAKYPPFPKVIPGQEMPIPANYKSAMQSEHKDLWIKAMHEEYVSLKDMKVFSNVDLPPGVQPLSSKWVYTWKVRDGVVHKAKARLVARGFEQKEGRDFDFLYAPTVASSTIKMLLAYAAESDSYIHQLDIKTAFLHGELQHKIYLHLPEGCDDHSGQVWELHRSLYGLRQAPREWYTKLADKLADLGFIRSEDDGSLFYKDVDGSRMFICIHVDDMLLIHKSKSLVLDVVAQINKIFEITDLGVASEYLGAKIERLSCGSIIIHQATYANSLVKKFLVRSSDSQMFGTLPLPIKFVFRELGSRDAKEHDECTPCDQKLYMQIVGSLLFLANFTRPDIAFAVNQLCRYTRAPSKMHWKASQYILRYINSTSDYGIVYSPSTSTVLPDLVGYCDASHNSCPDTFKSCTGFVYKICSGAIAWQSHMQQCIALSTAESEYMSINDCGKTAVWLRGLYTDIFLPPALNAFSIHVGECVPRVRFDTTSKRVEDLRVAQLIYNDNKSAIDMINSNHSTKNTKHIQKYHHWAREKVSEGTLQYVHIAGTENVSDALTKFLPADVFYKHRKSMGLRSLSGLK